MADVYNRYAARPAVAIAIGRTGPNTASLAGDMMRATNGAAHLTQGTHQGVPITCVTGTKVTVSACAWQGPSYIVMAQARDPGELRRNRSSRLLMLVRRRRTKCFAWAGCAAGFVSGGP
jgi:hypothetical protein